MALKRFVIDGYGQLELNNVAFRRTGRVEAQCHLGDDFLAVPAENGMLLAVDNVNRIVKFPVEGEVFPIALNYTTEHMYDERHKALRDFKLTKPVNKPWDDDFMPRLGYPAVGDKWITNCLAYDDAEFADEAALMEAYKAEALAAAPLYGVACENGAIKVTKNAPEAGLMLLAILGPGAGSMPDGQFGMKFHVVRV